MPGDSGGGDDVLFGGTGANQLFGGDGDDVLHASTNTNRDTEYLYGGDGADRFVFDLTNGSSDRYTIKDFSTEDTVVLKLDADRFGVSESDGTLLSTIISLAQSNIAIAGISNAFGSGNRVDIDGNTLWFDGLEDASEVVSSDSLEIEFVF